MKKVIFDFETRSRAELKKTGAFKYSQDPSTQPTCLSYKFSDPGITLIPFQKINLPWLNHSEGFRSFWGSLIDDGYIFTAHNVFFDRCIYENILVRRYGWPWIPVKQFRCTAAKASACALPRSLEKAGEALKLVTQKNRCGYVAMMAICKPKKTTGKFLEPHEAPDVWKTLYEYCKQDVLAEEALDNALPDLSLEEQEIWSLNQELNWRGLKIDIPLVEKIVTIMKEESGHKLKELDKLTMGFVTKPGAIRSILEFLQLEGVKLPNLQKKTVEDQLEAFGLSPDMRRLLELRQALSLASTKKYEAFLSRAGSDHRVRDILLYHGASTGRDTGMGIQPHNFPRGVFKFSSERPYEGVENARALDGDMLRVLYGSSLSSLFSSIIRNMIIPSEGYELFVADFAKIEVAVLWWLAGNEKGLQVLRSGSDPYIYQATWNTGKLMSEISESERQLGKAQVLGCGFGMGASKFQKTAWDMYRLELTAEQSSSAVQNYRRVNSKVPILWKAYEAKAVWSVETATHRTDTNHCSFITKDKFLWVYLPSGRRLAYREPQISWRENEYGPQKTLEFWAVNSKTKKWALERTWGGTLTENIVQAVARDLLMQAMVRLEKAGYKALLTVHDEIICEKRIGRGHLEEFTKIMCEIPVWGKGLPIEAKGWVGSRYRK